MTKKEMEIDVNQIPDYVRNGKVKKLTIDLTDGTFTLSGIIDPVKKKEESPQLLTEG